MVESQPSKLLVAGSIPVSRSKIQGQGTSEEVDVLKGHDFSRAASAAKSEWALAPEGMQMAYSELP